MKRTIYILTSLLLGSCSSKTNWELEGQDEFLTADIWLIDSIVGSEEFISDEIYFTTDNRFYRIALYYEDYLIDSSLTWTNDEVIDPDQGVQYRIEVIDSNHILLETNDQKLHAFRWLDYKPEILSDRLQN